MRGFLAALLIASIVGAASAAPQTLTGRVLDAQGAPVVGAEVVVYFDVFQADPNLPRLQPGPKAATGADDGYTFALLPPRDCNRVYVVARKDNGAPSWTEFYPVAGSLRGSKDITMEESASIAGTVNDEAGQPVAGAEVTADIYIRKTQFGFRQLSGGPPLDWLRTKTDAQGHFTIPNLPKGSTAGLHVKAPGKVAAHLMKSGPTEGAFAAGDMDIHVALALEARLQGTVVDEDTQKPLPGVRVRIAGNPGSDPQACITDANGAFEAGGLAAGDCSIALLQLPDELPSAVAKAVTVKDIQAGELRKGVVLPASPGGLLEVRLTNVKKEPLSGAHVFLWRRVGGMITSETAFSGNDGIAAFRLPPGTYQISQVDHELYSYQTLVQNFDQQVEKGKTLRVDMTVAEKPHALGVVVDPQGQPVAGATVTAFPIMSNAATITDKDGRFDLRWRTWNMPGNDISACLLVRKPEADLAGVLSLEGQERLDNLKITLGPGVTITGTVVDPDNRPIPKAHVNVMLQRNRFGSPIQDDPATAGQDGKYTIRALPAGEDYTVMVSADNFGRNQSPVALSAAKDRGVTVPPIALKRANLTISGIVVDADDKPVAGAMVSADGMEQSVMGAASDKDGKFTLKNLCDAQATIRASKRADDGSYQNGRVEFSADEKEVKIVLREMPQPQTFATSRASGVVLDPQGQPVASATVAVMPFSPFGLETRKTDKDGKFKVTWQNNSPSGMGSAFLFVREPKADLAAVFSLEDADKRDDLKITLAPGITITGTVVDPDNRPIPTAEVHVMLRLGRGGFSLHERIRTGQDGRYTIRTLPADQTYEVNAQANGFGRKQSRVDLTEAKDRIVEMSPLILKPATLTVTGIVVDVDGNPVSGAQIDYRGSGQNIQSGRHVSGKDGKFTLTNLCEGELRIVAVKQVGGQQLLGWVNYSTEMKEVRIVLNQNAQDRRLSPVMPKPQTLAGKPLPDLKPFGLDVPKDGKPILLCFWSQEQRPSRQCMSDLLALCQSPEGKQLSILTIQAEPVEREQLSQWTNKLPVGMIEKDAEKVRARWGVQSLPWFLLAAPDGAVLAEGFQLAQWQDIWKAKSGR